MFQREGGLFITFEGIEGCGKSTQARLLVDRLRDKGQTVIFTREPGGTPTAEKIREILLDVTNQALYPLPELLLYAASRAQHVSELILPTLKRGDIVVCDRFADSTVAYQGAGRKLPEEVVLQLISIATQGLKPDITFIVDVDVEVGLSRLTGIADRIESERIDFHRRVRDGYIKLAKREPRRIVLLDGQKSIEDIHHEILDYLFNWFGL